MLKIDYPEGLKMVTLNNNQSTQRDVDRNDSAGLSDAASDLLNDGKRFVNELHNEALNTAKKAEDSVKEYSDQLLKKVQENPLASVLIAAGVGFLLSSLLKK
jgi:ElaB/YqjD/DUF883 family membrane-anchored ribosome-binding protein